MKNNEGTKKIFNIKKVFIGAYDRVLSRAIESIALLILGGMAGLAMATVRFDPRVMAVEINQQGQLQINEEFQEQLAILERSDTERRVQVQMLILYQIPIAEREALRKEAQEQVLIQKQLQTSP